MIKGFFDETFDEHSRCVWIAGHVGDEDAWRKYAADWVEALEQRRQLHVKELRLEEACHSGVTRQARPYSVSGGAAEGCERGADRRHSWRYGSGFGSSGKTQGWLCALLV